ncbi:hypothetical protein cypCar_00040733, partial [Cyprinus carpio]
LLDEKFQIAVTNLPPNQKVTLHSLHQSDDKDFWEAFGHYVSDEHGSVTGFKDESLGGTYDGTEPMGLLWSMRPIPGSRHGLRIRKRDIFRPMEVRISVYSGHLSQGFSQQTPLATSVTERWYVAPGVKRVNIREKEIRGTLFLPPGSGPYPGVLDLWGVGGDFVEYRSALLASHGFASMALEYLTPEDLSLEDTDASYFEKAYQILNNHPMVKKDHLAVLGLSLGSAITLSMASYSKVIKVGRIKCPLLLVNGDDDQTLPAVESAEDVSYIFFSSVTVGSSGRDHSKSSYSIALDRTQKSSASMAMLGCADGKGAGSTYEPDSSFASEASNDMLSSMASHSLPLNETRLLAAAEGCWSGREKWTGETSLSGESEAHGGSASVGSIVTERRVPLPHCFFLTGSWAHDSSSVAFAATLKIYSEICPFIFPDSGREPETVTAAEDISSSTPEPESSQPSSCYTELKPEPAAEPEPSIIKEPIILRELGLESVTDQVCEPATQTLWDYWWRSRVWRKALPTLLRLRVTPSPPVSPLVLPSPESPVSLLVPSSPDPPVFPPSLPLPPPPRPVSSSAPSLLVPVSPSAHPQSAPSGRDDSPRDFQSPAPPWREDSLSQPPASEPWTPPRSLV